MNLPLPLADRLTLGAQKTWLLVLLIIVLALGVLCIVTGQFESLKRLWMKWVIKSREHKLEVINREEVANAEVLKKEAAVQDDLNRRRLLAQREHAEAELRVKGLSNEDVVHELRRRGF